MADDKTESDAKRASTRGFGGYLADRVANRADFSKSGGGGRDKQIADAERKAVGYAAGGKVGTIAAQSPASIRSYSKEYDTISPAGKNVHEAGAGRRYAAGGMVRRGFGKARGA